MHKSIYIGTFITLFMTIACHGMDCDTDPWNSISNFPMPQKSQSTNSNAANIISKETFRDFFAWLYVQSSTKPDITSIWFSTLRYCIEHELNQGAFTEQWWQQQFQKQEPWEEFAQLKERCIYTLFSSNQKDLEDRIKRAHVVVHKTSQKSSSLPNIMYQMALPQMAEQLIEFLAEHSNIKHFDKYFVQYCNTCINDILQRENITVASALARIDPKHHQLILGTTLNDFSMKKVVNLATAQTAWENGKRNAQIARKRRNNNQAHNQAPALVLPFTNFTIFSFTEKVCIASCALAVLVASHFVWQWYTLFSSTQAQEEDTSTQ